MIRGLIRRHPVLSGLGGFAIGRSAMRGNLFAILASLAMSGAYRDAKAIEAARQAAIAVGKTDPACIQDIRSPECIEHAKAAAIAAGQNERHHMRKVFLFVIACIGIIAVVQGIGHHVPH